MIEILTGAALATVQDLGRHGSLRYGVGTAGAMDDLALSCGNLLLGNHAGAAGIEIPVFPFCVCFHRDLAFAVTGGDFPADLDGHQLPPWWAHPARAGQVLTLNAPTRRDRRPARAYLTVRGGIDVPVVLASRSTQLRGAFGGYLGRALRDGDRLPTASLDDPGSPDSSLPSQGFGLLPPADLLQDTELHADMENERTASDVVVRAIPAAEHEQFDPASLGQFWSGRWKITAESDRYGYRLAGEPLRRIEAVDIRSHGIVPGVIQVPPSGQPIVQMRDAQPSGGYPKIATVIDADLWRLGQAGGGTWVRFARVDYSQALAAGERKQAYLKQVRWLSHLYASAGGEVAPCPAT